jgi:hypothetical protein
VRHTAGAAAAHVAVIACVILRVAKYRWMQAGAYQPFFRGHAHHDRYISTTTDSSHDNHYCNKCHHSMFRLDIAAHWAAEIDVLVHIRLSLCHALPFAANDASLGCLVSHGQQG